MKTKESVLKPFDDIAKAIGKAGDKLGKRAVIFYLKGFLRQYKKTK